ncbi:neprilysin-11-like [Ornithodoros turicata]|uniref:neprilysin-11-like n=1 Tax=Ornithodoros turicata TaxID=34597 RepID=UPI003138EABF
MLVKIIAAIDDSFTRFTFFNNIQNAARQKLSLLKRNIGYHPRFDTPDKVIDYYRDLPDMNGPFTDDFIKARRFQAKTYWNHIFRNEIDFINSLYGTWVPVFEANATYTAERNLLTIPPAMMYSPLFALGGPPEINYGALGRFMTHYIMRGYDQHGLRFDGAGALSPWFSQENQHRYDALISCMERMALTAPGNRFRALTWDEVLPDVLGSISVLNAYKKAKGQPGPSDKLFYVSWCLLWCGRQSGPSDDFRCNLPLMNSDHFKDTFACPYNSPMNPAHKCNFW